MLVQLVDLVVQNRFFNFDEDGVDAWVFDCQFEGRFSCLGVYISCSSRDCHLISDRSWSTETQVIFVKESELSYSRICIEGDGSACCSR